MPPKLSPADPQKVNWDEEMLSRRGFLQVAFAFLAGLGGLAVGGVATRFLIGNALELRGRNKIALAKVQDLLPNKVQRLTYSFRAKDAWREVEHSGTVFAYSEDGQTYRILSGTCTHLGCIVRWAEAENRFACPCHSGFYTREGEVISGPPPKPLKVLESVIEDGTLYIFI